MQSTVIPEILGYEWKDGFIAHDIMQNTSLLDPKEYENEWNTSFRSILIHLIKTHQSDKILDWQYEQCIIFSDGSCLKWNKKFQCFEI